MFNTSDPTPRNGDKKTRSFKNIGIGVGGLGLGYAGVRIGSAANKAGKASDEIAKAAESWKKASPAHFGARAWAKIRAKLRFNSKLSEIRFAKPGEMTEKYAPDSYWVKDKKAKGLFRAATAIGSTEKGVEQSAVGSISRSKRLSTYPPKTRVSRNKNPDLVGVSLGRKFSPQREAMMKAEITANPFGDHSDFNKKKQRLLKEHDYALNVTHKGHPENVIKQIKEAHGQQLDTLEKSYFAEVRSRKGYGMKLDRFRQTIRGQAAGDLMDRRKILQGFRQHVTKSLPAPLPESELNQAGTGRIQTEGRALKQVGHNLRKVHTGIAANHGKKAPFKVQVEGQMVEEPNLPAIISENLGKLQEGTTKEIQKRATVAERIHSALMVRSKVAINSLRKADNMTEYPHKELDRQASRSIHDAIYKPVPPEGVNRDTLSGRLGLRSPDDIDKIRSQHEKFRLPDQKTYENIQSKIIKEGKIFEPAKEIKHTYPALKKLGKGAAIGAGILGAGYAAKRIFGKKKEQQYASKLRIINFRDKDKPGASVAAHAVTGGLEGAASIYAVDPLLEKFKHGGKLQNPFRDTALGHSKKLAIGGLVGAIATAPVGALVERYRLKRALRENSEKFRLSAKGKIMKFEAQRTLITKDRYVKQIKEKDLAGARHNYTGSAIVGATLASLLRKRAPIGNAVLAGAGAGLAVQGATRIGTASTKDQFGERTWKAKRVDRAPWVAGGLAAAGIAARKYLKGHKFEIQFMSDEEKMARRKVAKWRPERLPRRFDEIYTNLNRGGRLLRDVKGKATGNNLDERGRERTPEWQRPWFKKAAAIGAIATAYAGRNVFKAAGKSILRSKGAEQVRSAATKVATRFPKASASVSSGYQKTKGFYQGVKSDTQNLLKRAKEAAEQPTPQQIANLRLAKTAQTQQAEEDATNRLRKHLEEKFAAKLRSIRFAEIVPDWDIRDGRGNSARVYAPGSQKRIRREKKWHEKKSNRDSIILGLLGVSGIGGASIPLLAQHKKTAAEQAAKAGEKIIHPGSFSPTDAFRKKWLHKLNAKLDRLINFEDQYSKAVIESVLRKLKKPSRNKLGGILRRSGDMRPLPTMVFRDKK